MKKRRVVDTNIFVRLFTKDDLEQYQKVHALFQHEEIFLIETVLFETELVLRGCFGKNEKSFSENEKDSLKNQLKVRSHRT